MKASELMADAAPISISDVTLVEKALKGDKSSFEILYQKYQRKVKITIWNYFRKSDLIDDLSQEIFLKAYSKLSSLKKPESFKGWLLRIAFTACVDHDRKKKSSGDEVVNSNGNFEPESTQADESDFSPQEGKVFALFNKLAPLDGLIVWLRYVEEMTYEEIGSITDISEVALRQRASRSIRSLRECINELF